jgi:hypothetical protein
MKYSHIVYVLWWVSQVAAGVVAFHVSNTVIRRMPRDHSTARWGHDNHQSKSKEETTSTAGERLESTLTEVDLILEHERQGSISRTDSGPSFLDANLKQTNISQMTIVALGTFAVTTGIESLLVDNEWLQAWRYFWPLVGTFYMADGLWLSDKGVLPFDFTIKAKRFAAVVLGFGLVVGGAYDAFMPVWDTGPNVITQAGIGQDSALALALLSITSLSKYDKTQDETTTLMQILLLGQLGALADGSIDELLGRVFDATPL